MYIAHAIRARTSARTRARSNYPLKRSRMPRVRRTETFAYKLPRKASNRSQSMLGASNRQSHLNTPSSHIKPKVFTIYVDEVPVCGAERWGETNPVTEELKMTRKAICIGIAKSMDITRAKHSGGWPDYWLARDDEFIHKVTCDIGTGDPITDIANEIFRVGTRATPYYNSQGNEDGVMWDWKYRNAIWKYIETLRN